MPSDAPSTAGVSALKNFLSGGAGGVCLVFAGHPFDLVKVRIQTQVAGADGKLPFGSATAIVRHTLRTEGVRGLYRGMAAPIVAVTPIFALCFAAYDGAKTMIKYARGYSATHLLSLHEIGVAGALSAVPTTAIMAPGERIKVILQIQDRANARFAGPLDVVRHLVKTEGVRSLFKGSAATLLRDGTGSYAYFAAYEWVKRSLTPQGQSLSPLAVVLGGGMAGVCNWLVALPFDVIKNRIQAQTAAGAAPSMLSVASELIAKEGVGAMYKGLAPALARAVPANAACFLGMELAKQALDKVM